MRGQDAHGPGEIHPQSGAGVLQEVLVDDHPGFRVSNPVERDQCGMYLLK